MLLKHFGASRTGMGCEIGSVRVKYFENGVEELDCCSGSSARH